MMLVGPHTLGTELASPFTNKPPPPWLSWCLGTAFLIGCTDPTKPAAEDMLAISSDLGASNSDLSGTPDLSPPPSPQSLPICVEATCSSDTDCQLSPATRCVVAEGSLKRCRVPCTSPSTCQNANIGTPWSGWACPNTFCVEA